MVWLTFYAHWVVISLSPRVRFKSIPFRPNFSLLLLLPWIYTFRAVCFDWLKGSLAIEWECRAVSSTQPPPTSYYAEVDTTYINLLHFVSVDVAIPTARYGSVSFLWMYRTRFGPSQCANVLVCMAVCLFVCETVVDWQAQQVIRITLRMKLFLAHNMPRNSRNHIFATKMICTYCFCYQCIETRNT